MACPASIRLCEAHVAAHGTPIPGAASAFGTRCHELAEAVLNNTPFMITQDDEELRRFVTPYVQAVRDLVDQRQFEFGADKVRLMVERRLATGIRDVWGTCDAVITSETEPGVYMADVIDLKTGGDLVPAAHNAQLMIYALGVAKLIGARNKLVTANLVISQIRNEEHPLDTWTAEARALAQFRTKVRQAVQLADSPLVQPVAGGHCQYCPAQATCPAHQRIVTEVFGDTTRMSATSEVDVVVATDLLTPQQHADILRHARSIRRFLDAVEEHCTAHVPPGWKLVEGQRRRTWRDDVNVIEALQVHDIQPRMSAVTITEAERLLRAGLSPAERADLMNNLTVTPSGRPTLVPESDPRPALEHAGAVFAPAVGGGPE